LNIPYQELTFGKFLGKGFFGEVRHGFWRQTDVGMLGAYPLLVNIYASVL